MNSVFYKQGCMAALEKVGLEFTAPFPRKGMSTGEKLRKVGPAAGGIAGLIGGALMARKNPGHLAKNLLAGFGTGATVGWAPDILASGYEALKG